MTLSMKRGFALIFLIFASSALAQKIAPAPAAYVDTMPDQITVSYLRTEDDYALKVGDVITETKLTGLGLEFRSRHFYPWELIGSARYSSGRPLGQHLESVMAGIGWTRSVPYHREHFYERISPVLSAQFGAARTSSNDRMYLYTGPRTGFTTILSAGVDLRPVYRLNIRPAFVEYQYLPFGTESSTYWNFGSGIGYNFNFRKR